MEQAFQQIAKMSLSQEQEPEMLVLRGCAVCSESHNVLLSIFLFLGTSRSRLGLQRWTNRKPERRVKVAAADPSPWGPGRVGGRMTLNDFTQCIDTIWMVNSLS